MRRLLPVLCLLVASAVGSVASRAEAQCVDEALREELIGKRSYRGVVPRLFKKALRHEISPMGGWYAADAWDGAPTYGGAYTFHFSEDLGLELSYLRYHQQSKVLDAVIDRQQGLVTLDEEVDADVNIFMGHLIWSLAYGKVRWMGGGISRFDFYLSLGAGATDVAGSRGVTGSGGFGMKFYLTEWLAFRLDVRDHVRETETVLGREEIVNDIIALGGLSLFVPFSS